MEAAEQGGGGGGRERGEGRVVAGNGGPEVCGQELLTCREFAYAMRSLPRCRGFEGSQGSQWNVRGAALTQKIWGVLRPAPLG